MSLMRHIIKKLSTFSLAFLMLSCKKRNRTHLRNTTLYFFMLDCLLESVVVYLFYLEKLSLTKCFFYTLKSEKSARNKMYCYLILTLILPCLQFFQTAYVHCPFTAKPKKRLRFSVSIETIWRKTKFGINHKHISKKCAYTYSRTILKKELGLVIITSNQFLQKSSANENNKEDLRRNTKITLHVVLTIQLAYSIISICLAYHSHFRFVRKIDLRHITILSTYY